jgi:hypothetical protein
VTVGSKDFTEWILLSEIVAQMLEAKNIEVDRDEIRELIHTAHFDPDPKKRAAAFAEIQKREAIT